MKRLQPPLVALLVACAIVAGCARAPDTAADAATAIGQQLAAGDLDGADERLRVALERWPEDPRLRELQGDIDLQRGNGTRAQAAFERAIRRAPDNRRLKVKLMRALLVQERYPEVLAVAEPAKGDPDDVLAELRLLRLEASLARAGVAAETREPEEERARRSLALAKEAEALWRISASGAPGMADVAARLGRLAAREDVVEAARQHAQCKPATEPARSAEWDAAPGRILRVGPAEELRTPGAAAAVVRDGDVVEIEAGRYEEGPVTWSRDNLRLRGWRGRPRLRLADATAPGAAAWTLAGGRIVVENLEFDGAGLALAAGDLTVRGSVFAGGAGIVAAGDAPGREILVTGTEFDGELPGADQAAAAGAGRPAIEAAGIRKVTVEFSWIHGARYRGGIASRAQATAVNYNRITGPAGPLVDVRDGGGAAIGGNEFLLGAEGAAAFVAFGEAARGATLAVVNNAFDGAAPGRVGVRVAPDQAALVANNVFEGAALVPWEGEVIEAGNAAGTNSLADPPAGNFGLVAGSPAIDAAVDPRQLLAAAPLVEFEYLHPVAGVARADVWTRDAGPHEYCAPATVAGELPMLPDGGAPGP